MPGKQARIGTCRSAAAAPLAVAGLHGGHATDFLVLSVPPQGMRNLRTGLAVIVLLAARAARPAGAANARVIPDAGVPRAAVAPGMDKLDVHLRRRIGAEAATAPAASGLEPVTGVWQRDGTLHVRIRLEADADVAALAQHGFTIERRVGDLVEGWVP